MSSSIIFTMFGSGLGGVLDLSIKNQYAGLASFVSVPRRPDLTRVYLVEGWGPGVFLIRLFLSSSVVIEKMRRRFVVLSAAIVFLSVLAFPTVIRFHFLLFHECNVGTCAKEGDIPN